MINNEDLLLTESQLQRLNGIISEFAGEHAAVNEYTDGIEIKISLTPFGKFIEVSYSGSKWLDVDD